MDFKYSFPGSVEIALDQRDVASLEDQGFCMDRTGFAGFDNKTWVRTDRDGVIDEPEATIDGDGDLNVTIPDGSEANVVIDQERIRPGTSGSEGIVEHYLGRAGIISVTLPQDHAH